MGHDTNGTAVNERDPDCPSRERLAAFLDGAAGGAPEEGFVGHLSVCPSCRWVVASWTEVAADPGASLAWPADHDMPVGRMRSPTFRWASAAAALLILASAYALWASRGRGGIRPVLEGTYLAASGTPGDRLAPGERISSGHGGTLRLEDGTRVNLEAGASLSLDRPDAGLRLSLTQEAGTIHLEVPRLPGGVMIRTPLGNIRVVGTRFSVSLHPGFPLQEGRHALLEVIVREGQVVMDGREGPRSLCAGECLIVPAEGLPMRMVLPDRGDENAAADILRNLDDAIGRGDGIRAALCIALLRHQGENGFRGAAGRILDRTRTAAERLLWVRVLGRLDREILERESVSLHAQGVEEPEISEAIRDLLEEVTR